MRLFSAGLTAFVPTLALVASSARAQVDLPLPSPRARVMQVVGLTEIAVDYSSPAARGRAIWGGLVPFNAHWRTGANANTLIRFSRDVEIAKERVPAGTYSLHTIPTQEWWTVILNAKTDGGGSSSYDEEQDVLRFDIKVVRAPFRERLTFLFSDTTSDQTSLDIEWAGVQARIPIKTFTEEQVEAVIAEVMSKKAEKPREAVQVANYLLRQKRNLSDALQLATASVEAKKTWYGLWTKARILGAKGELGSAARLAAEALELGDEKSSMFQFYAPRMKQAIARWRS